MSLAFFSPVVLFLKWLCQGKETHAVKNESVFFGAISRGATVTSHHRGQWERTCNEEVPGLSMELLSLHSGWGTEGLWLGWKGTRLSKTGSFLLQNITASHTLWEVAADGKTASYLAGSSVSPRTHRRVCPETGLPQPQQHSPSPTPWSSSSFLDAASLPSSHGSHCCSGGRGR